MSGVTWVSTREFSGRDAGGWVGGWFKKGMRWNEYAEHVTHPAAYALRDSIVANCVWCSGEEHAISNQKLRPVVDGVEYRLSWRAWGDLMAAVWSTALDNDYSYMDFYMSKPTPPSVWPEKVTP
jgi:hypothetical protein